MHVADDVERAGITPAVGEQRLAHDFRGGHRLRRIQHVDAAEPTALKAPQHFRVVCRLAREGLQKRHHLVRAPVWPLGAQGAGTGERDGRPDEAVFGPEPYESAADRRPGPTRLQP